MSEVLTRVIDDPKELESLSNLWNSLLQISGDKNSIHLTHEWISIWWKHFGQEKILNVVLVEKSGQVVGIFPLMRSEYRIGFIKIHVLETIGAVSCNYLGIVPSHHTREAIEALSTYLETELRGSKLMLKLDFLPEDSKLADALRLRLSTVSDHLFCEDAFVVRAPYIQLPATWEDFFSALGRNMRKQLPRKTRRLEDTYDVQFVQVGPHDIEARLAEFFDLHQKRWQVANIRGIYRDQRMRDFHLDIARQFSERGWLYFSCLMVDGSVGSAAYGFVYGDVLYTSTFARDVTLSKYNIGHQHKMHMVKYAIANELREVDLLASEDPYKFFWTKRFRSCTQMIALREGIGSGLRVKLVRRFLRIHRIRQYSLREIIPRYRIMKRMERDNRIIGLDPPG